MDILNEDVNQLFYFAGRWLDWITIVCWVNFSKRGGKDGVFRGLARLLQGISWGRSPREILRSSPASPSKTLFFPTLLLRVTFNFYEVFVWALIKCRVGSVLAFQKSIGGSVLALLKCIDGSIFAFFRFSLIFSHQKSADGELFGPLGRGKKSLYQHFVHKHFTPAPPYPRWLI